MRVMPVSDADLLTFGGQIRHRRQMSGRTYQALAADATISKSLLFDIESNNVAPSVFVAARIAKALGTTVDELLSPHIQTGVTPLPGEGNGIPSESVPAPADQE